MDPGTDGVRGLSVSSRTEGAHTIAALSGELDIASVPALREQLLGLLRPAASRLVIDLSRVSYADASGLAVLVATGRRAGLLGGYMRVAAPAPAVAKILRITGLRLRLDIFPTVQAAITSPGRGQRRPDGRPDADIDTAAVGTVHTGPPRRQTRRARHPAGPAELRQVNAAVLTHAGAWRDAGPCRRFTPALHVLARAHAGTSHAALTQAAHSLLSILTRQPLTYSPAVAAIAGRLRRLLDPVAGPPSPETNPRAPPPGAARPHRPAARDNDPSGRSLRAATRHCARLPPVNLPMRRLRNEASGMQSTGTGRAWRPRGDKADVPGVLHKSDADAVKPDLSGAGDVRRAYEELAGKSAARLTRDPCPAGGRRRTEVIIGVAPEPVSGPVVVPGPGGVATQVLSGHSARLAPLTDAGDLIRPVRAAPLLPGRRGAPAAGLTAISDTLLGSRCDRAKRQLP
jgi:anti-anti-sigma factor